LVGIFLSEKDKLINNLFITKNMVTKIESGMGKLEDVKDKAVVVGFFEDKLTLSKDIKKLDSGVGNSMGKAIKNKDFKGEKGEIKSLYVDANVNYVILLGLGKEKKLDIKNLMSSMGDACRKLQGTGISTFTVYLESLLGKNVNKNEVLEKVVEVIMLSLYQYTRFKTKDVDKIKKVNRVSVLVDGKADKLVEEALIKAEAVVRTRDLLNTPPNVATPDYVANYTKSIAKKNNLKCTVYDEKQLEKMGMECYVAVGQASVNKPRMIVLEYNGGGKEKPVVLVGKGLCYDTGGINVKPANYMSTMKFDKGGACTVIHVLEACAKLKLKVNVIGMAVMAENSVAGNAYKPDDILKSYSGITVEVLHSDAEGRMVLADALAYALKFKPKAVVDIATLTGASIIALGFLASPVMGTDQKVVDKLVEAGESSLDRLWQLPLWSEYEEIIKSDVADVKHLTLDMDAGVIIGGVFLKQFVKDVPWAHVDIGATVNVKQDKGYKVKGATGFGVLLFLDFLKNFK